MKPKRDQTKDGRVPADLLLEPAARHAWRAGIGFSTDTGPRMSLGYNNRYIIQSWVTIGGWPHLWMPVIAFNTNDIEIKQGYGAGLRWYSPIGRLRLDIAVPSDTESDDWRLHFGLGADL